MVEFLAPDLSNKLLHVGPFGNGWASDGKVTPTALAAPDTLKILRIPAGIRLDMLTLNFDDLDGATDLTFDAGYTPVNGSSPTEDTTFFGSAITTGQAGGLFQCRFDPILFALDVDILLNVGTAVASFQAGDIIAIAKGQNIGVK